MPEPVLTLLLPSGESCECHLRVSARCRRMSLHVKAGGSFVELVVPLKSSLSQARVFALNSSSWVERTFLRMKRRSASSLPTAPESDGLPVSLELKASGDLFQIELREEPSSFASAGVSSPGVLLLRGRVSDKAEAVSALKDWLRLRAEKLFRTRISVLSLHTGLAPSGLAIRDQKGRWGSCSSRGVLSLNMRLALMPPEILDYVIVHELCHLAEMNHSSRFWHLVESFQPGAKALRRRLNEEARALPAWIRI